MSCRVEDAQLACRASSVASKATTAATAATAAVVRAVAAAAAAPPPRQHGIGGRAVAPDRRYGGRRPITAAATRGGVQTRHPLPRVDVHAAGVGEPPPWRPAPGGFVPAGSHPAFASSVAL